MTKTEAIRKSAEYVSVVIGAFMMVVGALVMLGKPVIDGYIVKVVAGEKYAGQKELESIKAGQSKMQDDIDNLQNHVTILNTKAQHVDRQLDGVENKIDAVDTKIDSVRNLLIDVLRAQPTRRVEQ